MLELKNIKKDYVLKDQEPVHALKGISLKFRKNEFVAILGHSGCGKTTLLNIIGGLDHYDDGDLIIKGKSTKNFKDADWDTYRNHSVGFVFQAYNLIPHQSIIKNVELALTISGVEKSERQKRAMEALDLVGLKGLYKKKPNQLSGGQMQRVAIARALVNNPEIVLADEPTGALDSETSIQIMDLLKEVAKDHLVIMVTHNPELAEKYATRIVRMKDGELLGDSNPFDGEYVEEEVQIADKNEVNKGKKKYSSMNFFTATALSVANLLSKFKRTLLVAIAGSIGIIGVSAVIAVSCGVNNYILGMQDDMLSSYPIQITEEAMDMTSLLSGLSSQQETEKLDFDTSTKVGLDSMISYLMTKYTDFTNVKSNDISDELVEYIKEMPKDYYNAITYEYSIDPTNNIFTAFKETRDSDSEVISINGLTQRYIQTLMTVNGFSEYARYTSIFSNFMHQLPDNEEYITSQYDLLGNSRFPNAENEMVLVVDRETTLTDLILAQMGYYPQNEFLNIARQAVMCKEAQKKYLNGEISEKEYKEEVAHYQEVFSYESTFDFDELLNHEFYYYPHDVIYKTDPNFVSHNQMIGNVSGTDADGNVYILSLTYLQSEDALTGTYIKIDNTNTLVSNDVVGFLRNGSRDSSKSVIDGSWMGAPTNNLSHIMFMNINTAVESTSGNQTNYNLASGSTFREGITATPVNLSNGSITEISPLTHDYYYEAYMDDTNYPELAGKTIEEINGATKMKVVGILRVKEGVNFGSLSRGVYYSRQFADKYIADSVDSKIIKEYKEHIAEKRFRTSYFNAYVHYKYDDWSDDPNHEDGYVPPVKYGYSSALNGDLSGGISSIFASFISSMGDNTRLNNERSHLRALSGLKINEIVVDDNANHNEYETHLSPQSISIYPKDFDRKDRVTEYLDVWNKDVDITLKDGTIIKYDDRNELTYTDAISIIIEVIYTLINVITIALIAFTSLSLVVSCFMIAVITYISVMERVKEIGVIRSLGGRKRDVTRLFTAENLITGLSSGLIGIFITYIIQIIINLIVAPYGVHNIAALPWYLALLMIGVSILLSVLSGAIPSRSASKQDPVVALRSE